MKNRFRDLALKVRGKEGRLPNPKNEVRGKQSSQAVTTRHYDYCDPESEQDGFVHDDALNVTQHMLYVLCEIDRRVVEALVDSGASNSVISSEMVARLDLTHKCNPSIEGDSAGVGSAKIVGALENIQCIIGPVKFRLFFMVLDAPVPFLILGLDQLRRFQCCINLEEKKLTFGGAHGVAVPFLTRESAAQSVTTIFMTNQLQQLQAASSADTHQQQQQQKLRNTVAHQRKHEYSSQQRMQHRQFRPENKRGNHTHISRPRIRRQSIRSSPNTIPSSISKSFQASILDLD